MAVTAFSNWDFHNLHVQQELNGGQFISAESTLVAAGPPRQAQAAQGDVIFPIGLLETAGIQQSKQLQRVFEIGSSRSYFIPGRVIGSLTLGRTFYFGPSLLRVLYAHYRDDATRMIGTSAPIGSLSSSANFEVENKTIQDPKAALLEIFQADGTITGQTGSFSIQGLHKIRRNPGFDFFFIDLASDMFSQPTGMAIYFKSADYVTTAAMYLEECYVQGHQMTISSGSVLVMEGASLQFDRVVPIQVTIG